MGYFRENIERMAGYVPGFQPTETDIVKINTNENPYPPSPKVMEVLRNLTSEQLRRYPDPTAGAFRRAAAKLLGVGPEYIMCVNGGDELLSIAVRAFCDERRPLAYPVPTYSLYPVLAQLENVQAIELPFDAGYNLPPKLADTGAALTIVCNPNAPSGSMLSIDVLADLARKLTGRGVLLIDEAYVDFASFNCIEVAVKFENVIILRSMSKGYSLAGLRFGYAVANPVLIEGMVKVKDSYNSDAIAIAAATAAINDQEWHRSNIAKVIAERTRLRVQLEILGFKVLPSSSNFLLAQTEGSAEPVYNELVKRGIYVRYFKLPGLEDKMRISIGTPEQNNRLIAALEEIKR
jgi:histidinol-phosphate aminotransferase